MDQVIGSITIQEDKSLVLDLRAEGPDGMIGDARFIYQPGEDGYDMVLEHVGGLVPGESKFVPPWPEGSGGSDKVHSGRTT